MKKSYNIVNVFLVIVFSPLILSGCGTDDLSSSLSQYNGVISGSRANLSEGRNQNGALIGGAIGGALLGDLIGKEPSKKNGLFYGTGVIEKPSGISPKPGF